MKEDLDEDQAGGFELHTRVSIILGEKGGLTRTAPAWTMNPPRWKRSSPREARATPVEIRITMVPSFLLGSWIRNIQEIRRIDTGVNA